MARHELKTGGAWVELRETDDLRVRDRKRVEEVTTAKLDLDPETSKPIMKAKLMAVFQSEVPEAVATLLISSWHIPYLPDAKIPRIDPDVLDELHLDDYDRLMELIEPVRRALQPGSSRNVDQHADPASPSGPATG